jgi:hypothetical protein
MASSSPLTGVILIDCARANASEGLAITAQQCGYGNDIPSFQAALTAACNAMNISVQDIEDLAAAEQSQWHPEPGVEFSPDAPGEL